jgi:hypothetical protein
VARPTIAAVGSYAGGITSGTLTVTLPSHSAGQLLLVFLHGDNSNSATPTMTTPAQNGGWADVGNATLGSGTNRRLVKVCAIRATSGSMTNPTSTISPTGSLTVYSGRAIAITADTWLDTGTIADAWEDVTTQTAGTDTKDMTGLAAAGDNRLCIVELGVVDDDPTGVTDDSSYAQQGTNYDASTGSDMFCSTQAMDADNGEGGATFTFTSGGGDASVGIGFALKPSLVVTVGGGTIPGAATFGGSLATEATISGGTVSGAATFSGTLSLGEQTDPPYVYSLAGQHFTTEVPVEGWSPPTIPVLGGTVSGAATLSGSVSIAINLQGGTISGAATTGGQLEKTINVSGSVSGLGTIAGTPQITKTLAGGTVAGASAFDGAVTAGIFIQGGTVSGAAALGGTPEITRTFPGSVAGAATLGGSPIAVKFFTGSISGVAALAGALAVGVFLSGSIAGASTFAGTPQVTKAIAGGTVAGASTLAGSVGIESQQTTAPSVNSLASQHFDQGEAVHVTGTTAIVIQGGTIAGAATFGGNLERTYNFSGSIQGHATLVGPLALDSPLSGTIAGQAVVGGSPTVVHYLPGTISGVATLGGQLAGATVAPLVNSLSGQHFAAGATVHVTGTTATAVVLTGAILGHTTLGGQLDVARPFAGTIAGHATLGGQVNLTRAFPGMIVGRTTLAGNLTQPLALSFTSPPEGATVDYPFTVTGLAPAGSTVELRGDGGQLLATPTISSGNWSQLLVGPAFGGTIAGHAALQSGAFLQIEGEEGEIMPAHSATEASFSAPNGATATQADSGARAAPANRYRVRIINTHASDRLYVGRSQAAAQASDAEVIEADFGAFEDFLDPSVAVWVRPAGSNAITVRIIQYATS